jgi:hypothetical protein
MASVLGVLTKPLSIVDAADIDVMISEQVPESDVIEFKESLPGKNGELDPWMRGEDRVGDRAKIEVLEEVIAFANAHGGTLLIGIAETDDAPKRAAEMKPISRCAELADRLHLMARDLIDPQIPGIEIRGIITAAGGDGAVIIRVPESRLAPHRHRTSIHSTVRRADRTERMSMREIQDLTLQRAAAADRLEARFAERSSRFRDIIVRRARAPKRVGAQGARVTLIPTVDRPSLSGVHGRDDIRPTQDVFRLRVGQAVLDAAVPVGYLTARPILRGTRFETQNSNSMAVEYVQEVHSDGMVEFWLAEYNLIEGGHAGAEALYPDWVVAMVANALVTVDRVRKAAGTPSAE